MSTKTKFRTESTALAKSEEPAKEIDVIAVPVGRPVTTEEIRKYRISHVVSLAEGHGLAGIFRGEGAGMEFTDENTGVVRTIKTWQLETAPNVIARLPGSAGLDKHMEALEIGADILVVRGPQTNTRKGRRVNQYIVGPRI